MSDNRVVYRYLPIIIAPLIIVVTHIAHFYKLGTVDYSYSIFNKTISISSLLFNIITLSTSLVILLLYYIYSKKYFLSNMKNNFNILLFSLYLIPYYSFDLNNKMLAVILLILALYLLLKSDTSINKNRIFFNASFIIGLSTILFTQFLIFELIILIGIMLYGTGHWRGWLLSLLGFILPYYLFVSFTNLFHLNVSINILDKFQFFKIDIHSFKPEMIILGAIYILIFLLVIFHYVGNFSKLKINLRQTLLFNIYLYVLCLLGVFAFPSQEHFFFIVSLFPFTNLTVKLLDEINKVVIKIIYVVLIFILPVIYYVL